MKAMRILGLGFATYCLVLFGYFLAGTVVAYIGVAPEYDHLDVLLRIALDVGLSTVRDSLKWLAGADQLFHFVPLAGSFEGTVLLRSVPAHAVLQGTIFAFVVNFALNRQFSFGEALVLPLLLVGLTYSLLGGRLTAVGEVTPLKCGVVFASQYLGLLVGNTVRIFFRGHAT